MHDEYVMNVAHQHHKMNAHCCLDKIQLYQLLKSNLKRNTTR